MKTFMKILGLLFAAVAVAFTVCGIIDYFCNSGRGSYFVISDQDE